jgi:triacylglycerol esterase/lipase EstA (alpha/beta hydrolase family)
VVFVHGIYGSTDTFVNATTGYNWPKQFPHFVRGRSVDVYLLKYDTEMFAWARGSNPDFLSLARAVDRELKPLRMKQYRSIGFIAHSLGGNVISTYVHKVTSSLGHPQRAQHAYVITLGTPVLGAQIADVLQRSCPAGKRSRAHTRF